MRRGCGKKGCIMHSDRGCTYAAGIGKKYLSQAIRLLDGKNVSHGRAFVLSEDGTYREVWS